MNERGGFDVGHLEDQGGVGRACGRRPGLERAHEERCVLAQPRLDVLRVAELDAVVGELIVDHGRQFLSRVRDARQAL